MEYIEYPNGEKRKADRIVCSWCESEFLKDSRKIGKCQNHFCSKECDLAFRMQNSLVLVCAECGDQIFRSKSKSEKSKSGLFFCSRECKDKAVLHLDEIRPVHYGSAEQAKRKRESKCLQCGKTAYGRTYCSHTCQQSFQYNKYIENWKSGSELGTIISESISKYVRRYMLEKVGNKCERCGWCEVHPITGRIPLQIEHIDGNWQNSQESNLAVLCPNCHSLTPTYGSLNTGNGRSRRREKLQKKTRGEKLYEIATVV